MVLCGGEIIGLKLRSLDDGEVTMRRKQLLFYTQVLSLRGSILLPSMAMRE